MTTFEQTGTLNNDFRTCLHHLTEFGLETSPRGSVTKELLNYNITLTDPRNRIITFTQRKVNTQYLLGELLWYLSGSSSVKGILPYSKFWDNIKNSGEHDAYPEGTINSNYGNRLFGISTIPSLTEGAKPINQWQETIELLKRDKDTRQAILNIHLPSDRHAGNKDVPCTLTLQFFIRDDALHMIVNMRSNDIILGFTNDVFQFTMLQEIMQLQLKEAYPNLALGTYFHNAGSMHLYQRHFEMAENIIAAGDIGDYSMVPMDAFNDEIKDALIFCEKAWQELGKLDDFKFEDLEQWEVLTPYWQNLVNGLFLQDDTALHAIFGKE